MHEDLLFELPQGWTGLEPELPVERLPRVAVHLERVGLAAAAVERKHQLGDQALPERVLGDKRLQLGHDSGVATTVEIRVDPFLEGAEARLLQPRDLALRERLVGEVGERGAAPQPQRCAEQLRRLVGRPSGSVRDEPLKPARVEPVGVDPNDVAGRARDEHTVAEHLPQLRDVPLDHLHRRRRRLPAPEFLAEDVHRDRLVRVHEQDREQRALLRPRQPEFAVAVDDLEWPEDPELQRHLRDASAPGLVAQAADLPRFYRR